MLYTAHTYKTTVKPEKSSVNSMMQFRHRLHRVTVCRNISFKLFYFDA